MTLSPFIHRVLPLAVAALGLGLPLVEASRPSEQNLVGVTRREWVDSERSNWPGSGARPIRVTLWYPCDKNDAAEQAGDTGERVTVYRDAHPATAQSRRPLVLISHGSGGRAEQMAWMAHALARSGMIAAAVDHNGNDDEECHRSRPTLTDFFAWERARDLSVVLDRILEDPMFAETVDEARIGATGFSLGGTTALWLAGARLDLDALRLNSPPPPPAIAEAIESLIAYSKVDPVALESVARAGRSYRDPRVRAVFALAPPMGAGFTPAGLRDADVPALIVVGDADPIAPAEPNARHFAAHMPRAHLVVVPGERGHYVRPIPDAQRHAEMQEIARMTVGFFNQSWAANAEAGVRDDNDGRVALRDHGR